MEENLVHQRTVTAEEAEELQRAFVVKVYSWMMAGLLVTGVMSLLTMNTPGLLELLFSSRWPVIGLFVV